MTFNNAKAIRPHKKGGLPRLCMVDCGRGEQLYLHLHSLKEGDLEKFWEMSLQDQIQFLRKNCNHHHRLPRVCGGHTSSENISIVPTEAHKVYNLLVRVAAGLAGINMKDEKWEKNVKSHHIARALTMLREIASSLLCDPDTKQIDSPEKILEHFAECWLPGKDDLKLGYRNGVPYFYTKKS